MWIQWGQSDPVAGTGEQYWVSCRDEFTHYVAVIAVKSKDQISEKLIEIFKLWENQCGPRIKCVPIRSRGRSF
jgi:hypothetical protein